MVFSASALYHLTVDELRQTCVERALDSDVQARTLRRRVAEQVKKENTERTKQQEVSQASAQLICCVVVRAV